ncbi:DUF4434_domain-containing protein [Hexamita inflata]|uniref:DUF4434 domain-containing protein n=1 Tax=Hexamita inflata TaxID=28002 RepID=A0AA86R7D2_9EUKA|nr:DUF4434 domain-containing protein [Hexamita inflata]
MMLIINALQSSMPISGIFDAAWNSYFRDQDQINNQINNIKLMFMDTLILQYGIDEDSKYYDSQLDFAVNLENASYYEKILVAAEEKQVELYLGVYSENSGWWKTPDDTYLFRQRDRCIQVVDELMQKFSAYSMIKGFYIPHEIARYYWQNPADQQRLVDNFLKPVADHVHSLNKLVLISPYYKFQYETPAQLKSFLQKIFESGVDITAVQFGNAQTTMSQSELDSHYLYLQAIKEVSEQFNIQFWVNIELFIEDNNFAPVDRILKQRRLAERVGAVKLVSYDYAAITVNTSSEEMNLLFDEIVIQNQIVACEQQNLMFWDGACASQCQNVAYNSVCVCECPENTYQKENICYLTEDEEQSNKSLIIGVTVGVTLGILVCIGGIWTVYKIKQKRGQQTIIRKFKITTYNYHVVVGRGPNRTLYVELPNSRQQYSTVLQDQIVK